MSSKINVETETFSQSNFDYMKVLFYDLLGPPEPRNPPREPYQVEIKKHGQRVEWRKVSRR